MLTHIDGITTAAVVGRWLHGKSKNTQRDYERDIRSFVAFVNSSPIETTQLNDLDLAKIGLEDLQHFEIFMWHKRLSPATIRRKLACLKSFLSFCHRYGLIPVNVGLDLELPKLENKLAERILEESEVLRIIHKENNPRNKLILKFLYLTGCRASELANLRWRNIRPKGKSSKVALYGKGSKTRFVFIPEELHQDLMELRGDAGDDDPVFVSRNHKGHLSTRQIERIVKNAASRIGDDRVSPHYFRHSHATHALENGAPIQLVQQTLGHANVATTSQYLHANPSESSGLYLDL